MILLTMLVVTIIDFNPNFTSTGVPGPVINLFAQDVTYNTATIRWEPPLYRGTLDLTYEIKVSHHLGYIEPSNHLTPTIWNLTIPQFSLVRMPTERSLAQYMLS